MKKDKIIHIDFKNHAVMCYEDESLINGIGGSDCVDNVWIRVSDSFTIGCKDYITKGDHVGNVRTEGNLNG